VERTADHHMIWWYGAGGAALLVLVIAWIRTGKRNRTKKRA